MKLIADINSHSAHHDLKTQGKWTAPEHAKFLEAIEIWGKQWKHVSGYVKTRTASQCRSHAQKHFIKLEMSKRMLKSSSPVNLVEVVEITRPVSNISQFKLEEDGKSSQGAQYGEDIVFLLA